MLVVLVLTALASFAASIAWSRTLTVADMPPSTGAMEYYFTATNAGGTAQSPTYTNVHYLACIPS